MKISREQREMILFILKSIALLATTVAIFSCTWLLH